MNLFIESSQWAGQRASRASAQAAAGMPEACGAAYSLEHETYYQEINYGKKRARRRKLRSVLRVFALLFLMPLLLVAVFFATYCIACVLGGADLEEIPGLLQSLVSRVQALACEVLCL